jgi:hypothetical protein
MSYVELIRDRKKIAQIKKLRKRSLKASAFPFYWRANYEEVGQPSFRTDFFNRLASCAKWRGEKIAGQRSRFERPALESRWRANRPGVRPGAIGQEKRQ